MTSKIVIETDGNSLLEYAKYSIGIAEKQLGIEYALIPIDDRNRLVHSEFVIPVKPRPIAN